MLEEAYPACQPNGPRDTAHVDGYLDWVLELANERLARQNDGTYAMGIARRINPLTGEPLGLVWDTFYGDVTA